VRLHLGARPAALIKQGCGKLEMAPMSVLLCITVNQIPAKDSLLLKQLMVVIVECLLLPLQLPAVHNRHSCQSARLNVPDGS